MSSVWTRLSKYGGPTSCLSETLESGLHTTVQSTLRIQLTVGTSGALEKRTRHRMVMDQIPGRVRCGRATPFLTDPEQYECGKCGRLGHNSHSCHWQISEVQLVVISII
jgi:hypothetical protein